MGMTLNFENLIYFLLVPAVEIKKKSDSLSCFLGLFNLSAFTLIIPFVIRRFIILIKFWHFSDLVEIITPHSLDYQQQ